MSVAGGCWWQPRPKRPGTAALQPCGGPPGSRPAPLGVGCANWPRRRPCSKGNAIEHRLFAFISQNSPVLILGFWGLGGEAWVGKIEALVSRAGAVEA